MARGGAYVLGGDLVDRIGSHTALLDDSAMAIWLALVKPNFVNESRMFQMGADTVFPETYDGIARVNTPQADMQRMYRDELTALEPINQPVNLSCAPVFVNSAPRNATSELAKWKNLLDAKRVLSSLKVPFFLSDGTLLGYVRECGFIPHDPDVDIGVLASDYVKAIQPAMLAGGFKIYKIFGNIDGGLEMSYMKRGKKLDIMVYYYATGFLWHGIFKGGMIRKMKYPLTRFEWVDFLGIKVLVPSERQAFCADSYGANWTRPPLKDFNWWTSRANVFEEVQVP
jgi:hypothetical protein